LAVFGIIDSKMENDRQEPWFREIDPTDVVIREYALALAAVKGDEWHPSGTAVVIAPRFAITAKHLFDEDWYKLETFSIVASQVLQDGTLGAFWTIDRVLPSPLTDISLLHLSPVRGSQSAVEYSWERAPISCLVPPKVGETIIGFGYPRSEVEVTRASDIISVKWSDRPCITRGTVREVHDEIRDSGTLSYPCFRTNARFDNGMSGGPVFNEKGELCGIICSGIAPFDDTEEWASYVSSLWPIMGILVDVPIEGYPADYAYPLRKLARHGYIPTVGLDRVLVTLDSNNEVRVGLRKE
jgi:Trypsin-like peptidase domain